MRKPAVYIIANEKNGTIYTGVTSDIVKRVHQHKEGAFDGFTKKYNCKLLVFYELHNTMDAAIKRETQIKAGSRKNKLMLIENMNSEWKDLYDEII